MSMEIEKYKKAWKVFQGKMAGLKKRQSDILASISKNLDQQRIDSIMKKLKK
jgi:hypothetical protein